MALPYRQALERIEHYCTTYFESLSDASLDAKTRANLRERRDYWHSIGSKIRRRQEREVNRPCPHSATQNMGGPCEACVEARLAGAY